MRCPSLAELPPPPPGKTDWPWTVESARLPDTMPDGNPWPRISIVTPSYNQGRFLEETIRSVLLQGYPDLEYLIIDGGSSDQSVAIIKRYAKWLRYWVSEKDGGQSHAINKGIQKSTGLVAGWLNSDDVFEAAAMRQVAVCFSVNPDCNLAAGTSEFRSEDGTQLLWEVDDVDFRFLDLCMYLNGRFLPQPSVFFRRNPFIEVGGLDEDLHYAMDLDLWLRMIGDDYIRAMNQRLSWMRYHQGAKTQSNNLQVLDEVESVLRKYRSRIPLSLRARSRQLLRQRRMDEWTRKGLQAYFAGNRNEAKQALFETLSKTGIVPIATLRAWMGLVLRLYLPRSMARMLFQKI